MVVEDEEFAMFPRSFLPSLGEHRAHTGTLACLGPTVSPGCAKSAPKIGWGTARFDSMDKFMNSICATNNELSW